MPTFAASGSSKAAAVLVAAACLAFSPSPPARAGKSSQNEVTTFLESLSVGAGEEHRLLVIHPVHRAVDIAPDPAQPKLVEAGAQSADRIGLALTKTGKKPSIRLENAGHEQAFVLPGTVVRTKAGDFTVPTIEHAESLGRLDVAVRPVSFEVPAGETLERTSFVTAVLAPTLRFHTRPGPKPREVADEVRSWAAAVPFTLARHSLSDLALEPVIAKRVAGYGKRLAKLGEPPDGTERVGYVALVDGLVVAFESFADQRQFAAAWPRILGGLAVEACLEEARQTLLAEDIPETGDPDRYLKAVRERILHVYPEKPTGVTTAGGAGKTVEIQARNGDLARGLVVDGTLRYLVVLTDPKKRLPEIPSEDFERDLLDRRGRLTREQDRIRRRRGENPGGGAPSPGVGGGDE